MSQCHSEFQIEPFCTTCNGCYGRQVHLNCTLILFSSSSLAVIGDFISEMASKAAATKRLEKAQREAALEAVKMAKRERGFYKIHVYCLVDKRQLL